MNKGNGFFCGGGGILLKILVHFDDEQLEMNWLPWLTLDMTWFTCDLATNNLQRGLVRGQICVLFSRVIQADGLHLKHLLSVETVAYCCVISLIGVNLVKSERFFTLTWQQTRIRNLW